MVTKYKWVLARPVCPAFKPYCELDGEQAV